MRDDFGYAEAIQLRYLVRWAEVQWKTTMVLAGYEPTVDDVKMAWRAAEELRKGVENYPLLEYSARSAVKMVDFIASRATIDTVVDVE